VSKAGARPPRDPLVGLVSAHTTLLLTALLFVFVIMRVLRVSEFDPETAKALVRAQGVVPIAVGVLAGSLTAMLSVATYFLASVFIWGPGSTQQRRMALIAALVIGSALTYLIPWLTFVVSLGVLALLMFALHRVFKGQFGVELFAVVGVILSLVITPDVWLPAEVVRVSGADQVAYVIDVGDPWTTLMDEDSRAIKLVPTASIESRALCTLNRGTSNRTLSQVILGEKGGSRYALCPDSVNG
jgi:hypothetical protein